MQKILVDSNVILDIITEDPIWSDWSACQLEALAEKHLLVINPIIYAEVSVGFIQIEELEQALPPSYFRRESLPWEAAFLAGKAYLNYRKQKGTKHLTMPDFYIGAHALIQDMILLTRDNRRYATYFPKLKLITP
jgi:predicted nucleic acid-binding protein